MEDKETKNTGASVIRSIMGSKKITMKQLADELGYKSAQVLANKLYRDTLSLNEYVRIANVLNCDVKTIAKDGSIEILNQYKENK